MSKKLFIKVRDQGFNTKEFGFSNPKSNLSLATIGAVAQLFFDAKLKNTTNNLLFTSFDSAYYEETIRTDVTE